MKYQFLLCENPKGDKEEQYIYHSKSPRFFAKILSFHEDAEMAIAEHTGHNTTFYYNNPESIREIYTLVVTDQIDEAPEDLVQSKLKRMADWYMDYIMWQDRELSGNAGESSFLEDYNAKCPLLKVIYTTSENSYMIIYKGISKSFKTGAEMDAYLVEKLQFTQEQIADGYINEI